MRFVGVIVAATAFVSLSAPPAGAVPIVVTNGSAIVNADTNNLPSPSAPIPVTGLQGGETLLGIDQRPATGQLYGIGFTGRVYVIDTSTGVATQVGGAAAFTPGATAYGTDFNPVVDRIRVVSDTEENLRLNPDDGTLTSADAALNPTPADVVAAAYSDNTAGATSTTLYDINWFTGKLYTQGGVGGSPDSPNTGNLHEVGSLNLASPSDGNRVGFDIGADGVALATITTGGVSKLFGINLTTGQATNLGTIGTGTVSYSGLAIMPSRIRFTSGSVGASEGGTATFTLTRSAPAPGPVSVTYSTGAGTATSGADFTPASGTVSWGAGESGAKTIAVPVSADSAAEGDETFSVSISSPEGADVALGSPAMATATIAANEAGPTLQFGAPSAGAVEGAGATLTVTRVGSTAQPVSVDYATAPGTATVSDYMSASGTLSWAAGDGAAKTISIPITDDQAAEGAESFAVNLLNPSSTATLGNPASAAVTIAPSDPATLKLGGATKQKLSKVRRSGVAVEATVSKTCLLTTSIHRGKARIARTTRSLSKGKRPFHITLTKKQRDRLRAKQRLNLSATCSNAGGKSKTATRTVTLTSG
jgi:hypothetical protein